MKIVVVCPFDIDRLTGTPIRSQVTIRAVADLADVIVIAVAGTSAHAPVVGLGKCSLIAFTQKALRCIRDEKPDVIHGITTASILPMLLYKCMRPSVRLVFEMHGWAWFEQRRGGKLITRAMLLALDYVGLWIASRVIAMSNTQRMFLSRRTWSPSRIATIWGPCEFEIVESEVPKRNEIIVGYVGNAAWWQGLPHLVGAATVLKNETNISFHLAGFDASDTGAFPRMPHVTYFGRVERRDVPGFLRDCDMLVSCRLTEGAANLQYPQKLSEYLGAGRPVIVSATNDQCAIVQEAHCGIVMDRVDADALAETIRAFAGLSDEKRARMRQNALRFARKHFAISAFSEKIKTVYSR
jgi:glycosyltransferase involved in cell wall biosynthesis